jgi:hypothetical protein
MRGLKRGGAAVLLIVGIVVGGAGVAAARPQKQSTSKYAKTVCGTYQGLLNDITGYGTAIGNLDPTDPTGFQTSATTQTTALINQIKVAEKKLSNAYPDISNGQKVGKLLATNASELDTLLTSAEAQLAQGGIAGATQFTASIATLSTKLSDPFSKVTDQDLINAFQKEKTCKNVVQVEPG